MTQSLFSSLANFLATSSDKIESSTFSFSSNDSYLTESTWSCKKPSPSRVKQTKPPALEMGKMLVAGAGPEAKASSYSLEHLDQKLMGDNMTSTMMDEGLEEPEAVWMLREYLGLVTTFEPKMANLLNVSIQDMTKVSPVRRNQSAYNLKCLTAFYSLPHEVFCLALNTLDRFITKVKVQPRYLSCITTTCFYHAVKAHQGSQNTRFLEKLIRVSQCDCRVGDIHRMETIINDKLRLVPGQDTVTHLTLLKVIVDTFTAVAGVDLTNHLDKMGSKLVMCLCHAELLHASFVTVALAVFCAHLQSLNVEQPEAVAAILNICQISEREFLPYQEEITQFLEDNYAAPSPLPKLQLKWAISNRTMARLRPGYYGDTGLPVIPEAPYESMDISASSVESLTEIEDDDVVPGTPTPEDFNHHFSYPNSPSEPSPLSSGLTVGHILTYADVVSGKLYHTG